MARQVARKSKAQRQLVQPKQGWQPSVDTDEVLLHEYRLIWGEDAGIEDYPRKVHAQKQAALCLSGGGIRSAAFALGVMQAFSRANLLTGFHYLSTVSGGGYIGSWLQRWIKQEQNQADTVMKALAAVKEPIEIKRLRENSNFITPKVGIGSNDTWTAVAISVRNILINWLLFAPLLMLVALLPNLFLESVASIRGAVMWGAVIWGIGTLDFLLLMAGLSIAVATAFTALMLPSYRAMPDKAAAKLGKGDTKLFWRIVAPLVLWSILATLALSVELLRPLRAEELLPLIGKDGQRVAKAWLALSPELFLPRGAPHVFGLGGVDVAVATLAGLFAGLMAAAVRIRGRHGETFDKDYVIWPFAFLVTAGLVLLGVILFNNVPSHGDWGTVLLTVFGPLWLLLATLMGANFFAGLRKTGGPTVRPDDDVEWLARLSAIKFKPMLFWAILAPSVLVLNRLGGDASADDGSLALPSLVAAISGIIAVFGGRSASTGALAKNAARGAIKYVPVGALIGLATLLFLVALLMLFGRLEFMLADWIGDFVRGGLQRWPEWLDPEVAVHLTIVALLFALLFFFGRAIPVNKFSLNGLYRNRLARGFLGAARPEAERTPDPFTGFDAADNVRLRDLVPTYNDRTVLYPVINVALNVTATENLAWQERKAEPFILTPSYCGSAMLAPEKTDPPKRIGAFVQTSTYAGREPDFGMNEKPAAEGDYRPLGVTLATAMSLSGAAATPNMGYYSSPATAFLMTLFNVRLGAWMPNPARWETLKTDISRSGPKNSIMSLLRELGGSTHDRGRDIYLSDGGHFENLGLYEMIRRRCRYIVISDAAADPKYALKDLGNAVRKVKIDLDVDIEFAELRLSGRDRDYEPAPQLAWALGRITYPETIEDGKGARLEGWILYIKPSFFGEGLPADVVAYARGNSAFPHESTADQFFSESQFESYRHLAAHLAGDLIERAKGHFKTHRGAEAGTEFTMPDLFNAVIAISKSYQDARAGRKPASRSGGAKT